MDSENYSNIIFIIYWLRYWKNPLRQTSSLLTAFTCMVCTWMGPGGATGRPCWKNRNRNSCSVPCRWSTCCRRWGPQRNPSQYICVRCTRRRSGKARCPPPDIRPTSWSLCPCPSTDHPTTGPWGALLSSVSCPSDPILSTRTNSLYTTKRMASPENTIIIILLTTNY